MSPEKKDKKILTLDDVMNQSNGADILVAQIQQLTENANRMQFKIQHLEILLSSILQVLKTHEAYTDEELQKEIEETTQEYAKMIKQAQQNARPSEILTTQGKVKTS